MMVKSTTLSTSSTLITFWILRFAKFRGILKEKKIDIDFRQSLKCRYSREKYYFCGNPFSSLPVLGDTSGCHEEWKKILLRLIHSTVSMSPRAVYCTALLDLLLSTSGGKRKGWSEEERWGSFQFVSSVISPG